MKLIYRLIMIGLLLTLPTYGATLKDLDNIVKQAKPLCSLHHIICSFRVIEFSRPLAYTQYNRITLSSKTVEILTKDELKGVVFHEVAHAVLRHSEQGQSYIMNVRNSGREPTVEELSRFRYRVEYEADRYSVILLYLYGQRSELPSALGKMSSKSNTEESFTHPSNQDRINKINKLQKILSGGAIGKL